MYEVCDSLSLCDIALVTISVDAVNDPPLASNDSVVTPEDTLITIEVAANDSDPESSLDLTSTNTVCAGCAGPDNGSLTNNGDGSFSYSPNPNFNGSDSFVYEICDTGGLCDTAVVTISVDAVNDPPVANDDGISTVEDTAVTIDVAANDTDPESSLDPASATTICAGCDVPDNGSLTNNGDGSFSYTPNPSFTGSDSFVYEICDTSGLCDTATVTITVTVSVVATIIEVRVAASADDVEEQASGDMSMASSDLELVDDAGSGQTVGLRFTGVDIPQGATVVSAYVQFQVDETGTGATSLTIEGEAGDDAPAFTTTNGNVTSRSRTNAAVAWAPPAWTNPGEAGPDQRTADIAAVVEEIVDRPGWASGNALVIIIGGSGTRTAEAYNGDPNGAPLLHVEYTTGS